MGSQCSTGRSVANHGLRRGGLQGGRGTTRASARGTERGVPGVARGGGGEGERVVRDQGDARGAARRACGARLGGHAGCGQEGVRGAAGSRGRGREERGARGAWSKALRAVACAQGGGTCVGLPHWVRMEGP